MATKDNLLEAIKSKDISDLMQCIKELSVNDVLKDALAGFSRRLLQELWDTVQSMFVQALQDAEMDCAATGELLLCITRLAKGTLTSQEGYDLFFPPSLIEVAVLVHGILPSLGAEPASLKDEISQLFESWWLKQGHGREELMGNTLIYLLTKSTGLKATKSDVARTYAVSHVLDSVNFDREGAGALVELLLRCCVLPQFLNSPQGVKFLAYLFTLNPDLTKMLHQAVKNHLPAMPVSWHPKFAEVYLRAWQEAKNQTTKEVIEHQCIQDLMYRAVHAQRRGQCPIAKVLFRVLSMIHKKKNQKGVEAMLTRLYEPILWRSLMAANSDVRINAAVLMFDTFPLQDADLNREQADAALQKQFDIMHSLLSDPVPEVRLVAVRGVGKVLNIYWELIPADYELSMDEETVARLESEIEELNKVEFDSEGQDSIDGFRELIRRQLEKMCGRVGNTSPETSAPSSLPSITSSSAKDFRESRTAFIPSEAEHKDSEDIYDFTHRDRGLALIINNEDFSSSKNFGSRPGSSYDEASLYQTFKKLSFKVLVKRNLTSRQMVEVLKLVKNEYDHANADCFVCCILTHGDETISRIANDTHGTLVRQDLLFGVDGKSVPTRTVVEFFNDKHCPALQGKPRLFFLQACRGSKYDHGSQILVSGSTHPTRTLGEKSRDGIDKGSPVDQTDSRTITRKNSFSSSVDPPEYHRHTLDSTDAKPVSAEEQRNRSLPTPGAAGDKAGMFRSEVMWAATRDVPVCPTPLYKDCLVMYATPPGHYAWRRKNGAWFVQSLCAMLNDPSVDQTSLLKALVRVCYQVATFYQSENPYRPDMHEKKETPVIESMLVKDLFFTKRKK